MAESDSDPEGRLNIQDVPQEISRIFFGGSHPGGGRPSYNDDGYGAPLAPLSPGLGGGGFYNSVYYAGWLLQQYFHAECEYVTGYEDDIYLLIKLGQAALIIFIILAVISVLFLVTTCCISVLGVAQQRSKDRRERNTPPPFNMKVIEGNINNSDDI